VTRWRTANNRRRSKALWPLWTTRGHGISWHRVDDSAITFAHIEKAMKEVERSLGIATPADRLLLEQAFSHGSIKRVALLPR
jgi:hypothetical protein